MDQMILSSRAIMGMYQQEVERQEAVWLDKITNKFTSTQASEQYGFLGQVPKMRLWEGGRQAKSLASNDFTILNSHYENTLSIANRDRRLDKTGQIEARIREFAGESLAHWQELAIALIEGAEASVCYDGQYFFDTDHSQGLSGTQSNDITVDISALPAQVHGSVTAPSTEEFQQALATGIAQLMGFKDDQGRSVNANARSFLVTVPLTLWVTAAAAISALRTNAQVNNQNPNALAGINIEVQMIPELTWTDKFAIWRQDSAIKGLILQEEYSSGLEILGEGSDFEFHNKAILLGQDTWRGAGYGRWDKSCLVQMV